MGLCLGRLYVWCKPDERVLLPMGIHCDYEGRSWIAAFPALTQEGPARGQMRHLDSVRGHQVSALKKRLGFSEGQLPSGKKGYYGRPYSYYGS